MITGLGKIVFFYRRGLNIGVTLTYHKIVGISNVF